MSGRSAYVRKKITEQRPGGRHVGSGHSELDAESISESVLPQSTGYGTTNARLLKFYETAREAELNSYRPPIINLGNNSSGSQSGGSESGKREGGSNASQQGPMPDYAYARARKPVLRTEDVSGIERSGFRSAMDKKSDEFRKGITKAFSFGAKKKKGLDVGFRPDSSATVRGHRDMDSFDMHEGPGTPAQHPSHLVWDPEYQQMLSPPPSAKLPPIPPQSNAPPIKRWIGAGRPVQRWNKLRKDPELWDPNGDVLVFLGRKGQVPRLNPSFRLSSHIIETTESRFLLTLLREGSTEDEYDPRVQMPPSPIGAPPMLRPHGVHQQLGYIGRNGQPTPPVSEDTNLADADGQISYEMYFPTPPNLSRLEAHRHAITTRNVFALLYHASLVGLSLFQALSDLLTRLTAYMPSDADNLGTILNYLSGRGIDDSRNDPETAVSMLAWSESAEVRWEEGWNEAFVHCAGMYSRLEACADFKNITPITRALLERAYLETQLRVQAAEERLAEFSCGDIWPTSGPGARGPARDAAERLRQFFVNYHTTVHGDWPPPLDANTRTADGEDIWLTRTMARQMQKEFGALYDYLVNRDIVWDESETRSSRKWMMVSESGNKSFDPDTPELPLTDMLIEFDNRMRFPHIPHPYPLVPESIPPISPPTSGSNREKLRKDKNSNAKQNGERRAQLAYTEATNIYILGSDFTQSDLIESFVKFEKADQVGIVDPFVARRGRWVLIYGILQTLASVSVDSPNIRYKDNVAYHMSPCFNGAKAPPWKGASGPVAEARHELSHCWTVPRTWQQQAGSNNSGGDSGGDSDADVSVTSRSRSRGGSISDPVLRMMRAQARMFPRPPGTPATTRSNKTDGWYTARSVQSSIVGDNTGAGGGSGGGGLAAPPTPTIWGGSSARSVVSSYSEDAGSIARPHSSARYYQQNQHQNQHQSHHQNQNHGYGSVNSSVHHHQPKSYAPSRGARSERSYATFGPGPGSVTGSVKADDNNNKWPEPHGALGKRRMKNPKHLDLHLDVSRFDDYGDGGGSGGGGYSPTSVDGSRSGGNGDRGGGSGGSGGGGPILSPNSSDGLGPVIRDFDELESVVEESL
ncbi:uncharacterized protein GGS25DRAFT_448113 [Hypoxylon fragiforme]|uniref:uncharacterized protein n=1 Tax=Hypoxylon fragiforme TaxID=63214 RepID=UPI0020C64642|nr:uncharacterized protein GGS25DRAFT_448113 [Hypoxylon fragiforme]KAI2604104.1 hypothetical protein GGS25DRAFT_448113 [Hypoxylon fragiforme]